jgi:O-antigen/teichoic acid export membrane protein
MGLFDPTSSKQMFAGDSIHTFVVRVAAVAFAFFTSIIVSNLGPEVKGEVAIVIFLGAIIKLVSTLGFETATVYFLRRKLYNYGTISRALNLAYPVQYVVSGIILFPTFYIGYSHGVFGDVSFKLIGLAFAIAPLEMLFDLQINFFAGCGEIKRGNMVGLLMNLLYVLILGAVILFVSEDTVGVLAAYAMSVVAASVLAISLHSRKRTGGPAFEYNPKLLKDLASYGIRSQVGSLTRKLASRVDLMMINVLLAITSAGIYSVALNWAEMVLFVPLILHFVLFPYASERPRDQSIDLTNRVTRLSVATLLTVGILVCAAFPVIERIIYKPDYSAAIVPLIVIMPGVVFIGLFRMLMGGLDGLGKPQYATYATTAGLVLTIVMNYAFIPKFGLMGAAIATTLTNLSMFSVVAFFYVTHSQSRLSDFLVPRVSDFAHVRKTLISLISDGEAGRS